jgi:sulfate/thiosulfate-binding protein
MRWTKWAALIGLITNHAAVAAPVELLNVSYDPTREFYEEYNAVFIKHWKEKTGQDVFISQSHGGSGKQARAVIEGLKADVVTLALAYDIDVIADKTDRIPADWQKKLPNASVPFTSTVVFLVRKGNPKKIQDWEDLVRKDVQVIMPNPKTSGGARWHYLAAWGYAKEKWDDEEKIREYMSALLKNVPVLDAGARGATTTFAQRAIGDVLLSWENDAFLAQNDLKSGEFEIVMPSVSILAEPTVAVVEKNADAHGALKAAQEYLKFLYSPQVQEIAARHYYRPTDEVVAAKYAEKFPHVRMFSIAEFGGWKEAQKKHFDDGGTFDQIYGK